MVLCVNTIRLIRFPSAKTLQALYYAILSEDELQIRFEGFSYLAKTTGNYSLSR